MSRRVLSFCVVVGALLSLAVSFQISTRSFFVGSDDGGWVYPYFWPFTPWALVIVALTGAIVFALFTLPSGLVQRRQWPVVMAWLLAGLLIQGLLRGLTPFSFEQMFVSDSANSFYGPTRQHSTTTLLADFDRLRSSLPLHAQSNMPGKLIFVSLLRHVSVSPAVMAWIVVLISNLGGVLLYLFVRDLFNDPQTALFSLVLYLLVPGKLYFFPLLNTVTPVLALALAYLLQRWLQARTLLYPVLAGVTLYLIAFFDPLPLVMGCLFLVLIARAWSIDRLSSGDLLQAGMAGFFGFAATYAIFFGMFRFDLLATFRQTQIAAAAFNATVHRPYGIWVRGNLVEFAFGMGICQVCIFFGAFADAVRRAARSIHAVADPAVALALGLGGVLLAIDLLGVNRGEVTRLWIFLACFCQIPAAYACARLQSRTAVMLILGTTLLQGALGTSMIAFILP